MHQRGAALFLVLLLIIVGGGIAFVSQLKSAEVELDAQRRTAVALAEAKQVLLGRALLDNGGGAVNPGRLPCPDQDNDGDAEGAVCATPYVGWLPWETLGVGDTRDGAAEKLWYVVDSTFLSDNAPLNTATPNAAAPALRLNGVPVVAVIFAPQVVLSALGQNRPAGGPVQSTLVYANYLESFLAAGPSVSTAPPSPTFNDQVIGITPRELFTLVTLRMARELSNTAYGPGGVGSMGVATIASIPATNKPTVWTQNQWDSAVDGPPNNLLGPSTVSGTTVVLKFQNCGIIFKISGPGAVARSQPSC